MDEKTLDHEVHYGDGTESIAMTLDEAVKQCDRSSKALGAHIVYVGSG